MNSSDNKINILAPGDNATVAAKTVNNVTNATVPSNNTITNTTIVTKPIILPNVNGTFFFVHIGKTAGTSIRGTLRPPCNDEQKHAQKMPHIILQQTRDNTLATNIGSETY